MGNPYEENPYEEERDSKSRMKDDQGSGQEPSDEGLGNVEDNLETQAWVDIMNNLYLSSKVPTDARTKRIVQLIIKIPGVLSRLDENLQQWVNEMRTMTKVTKPNLCRDSKK